MLKLANNAQGILENITSRFDFIAPLLLRLYLAPVFYMAGIQKFEHFDSTVEWFGNPDWGLGLPFPVASGGGLFATDRTIAATERLDRAKSILQEHGNYEWLTEYGSFVVLNNGIEFAATYLVMLIALLYLGGGRFLSCDYWIQRRFRH